MNPARLEKRISLLACPLCGDELALSSNSLLCGKGHCFDLNRKGFVNLAPGRDTSPRQYETTLFEARRRILEQFYQPVAEAVAALVTEWASTPGFTLVDAGCGEGYYARQLLCHFPEAVVTGVDLSRDGITLAGRGETQIQYLIADLKRMPFRDHSMDFVLDMLTPADYREFARVLKPGGCLIKGIPGEDYLREIRELAATYLKNADNYSNQNTREHLSRNAEILKQKEIRVTYSLTREQAEDFLRMTPLTSSLPEGAVKPDSLDRITVHMIVYLCSFPSK